ncbi:holin [Burkholderia glumae]
MLTVFFITNVVVLMFCIWISISDGVTTGWWGTIGFSIIGLASALNIFKEMRWAGSVDGPETLLMIGLSIVCVWVMARRAYWWRKRYGTH